jgi:hypothetical protein
MHIDPVTPRLYSENLAGATGSRPADKTPEPSGGPAAPAGFEPSPDRLKWTQALRDLPDVRADVVADTARRLRAGEVLSPSSPEETAQAVLGQLAGGE